MMRFLLMLVLMVALLPSHVLAQDCVDYGDYLHPVGHLDWDIFGPVNSLTISGDYLFAPTVYAGLLVIDISDPGKPQITGSVETPGHATNAAIEANYAYVTDGDFQVIDFSNPENPQIVGSVETPGYSKDVVVEGNISYVADGAFGLQVIDISNPENPQLIGGLPRESPATGVAVDGNLVYLASDNSMEVIDVTNPESPQVIGSIQTEHWSTETGVVIEGNYAYITQHWCVKYCSDAYLTIVDISNPENPQLLSSVNLEGAYDIEISGSFVFAKGATQVKIIDISDHQAPEIIYSTEYLTYSGSSMGIACSNDSLYLMISQNSLMVYDVSNPESVPVVGSMDVPDVPDRVGSLTVTDNHLVMAVPPPYPENFSSLLVVDITDPLNAKINGSVNTPGSANGVVAFGDYVYVADGDFGLQVVDISDSTSPQIISSVETPGRAAYVAGFPGNTNAVYITDGENGLHVIDVSDPDQPHLAGSVDTPWAARYLAVSGDYVYVTGDSYLQIFDVTNAQDPYFITSLEIQEGDVKGIAVEGNYVYVTWRDDLYHGGLKVIDCSIPENPLFSGTMTWEGHGTIRTISDGLAYICLSDFTHNFDILVIDVTMPHDPQYLGGTRLTATSTLFFSDIAVYGDYLFAELDSTLITIPNHCFATTGIEDDPIDPDPSDTPPPLVILSVYPNPFNPCTTVSFTVNYPQVVELSIFDMAGKLVSVLADCTFEAGEHSIVWQGRDQEGHAVSSGSYLVKMSTKERVTTQKMMLIR